MKTLISPVTAVSPVSVLISSPVGGSPVRRPAPRAPFAPAGDPFSDFMSSFGQAFGGERQSGGGGGGGGTGGQSPPPNAAQMGINAASRALGMASDIITNAITSNNQREIAEINARSQQRIAEIMAQSQRQGANEQTQAQLQALQALVATLSARQNTPPPPPTTPPGMSQGAKTALIVGGVVAGVVALGAVGFALAKGGRARRNPTPPCEQEVRDNPVVIRGDRRFFLPSNKLQRLEARTGSHYRRAPGSRPSRGF
jgi:hypothetical protein